MTVTKTLSTPTLHWARIGRARRFIRDHAAEPLTLDGPDRPDAGRRTDLCLPVRETP